MEEFTAVENSDTNELRIVDLAKQMGCDYTQLQIPIKRLKTRDIGVELNPAEVDSLIKYFSKDKLISKQMFQFILEQYKQSQELISLAEIAKDKLLNNRDFHQFLEEIDKNERYDFLVPNIFPLTKNDTVKRTKVDDLVNLYLKKKISENTSVSAFVPTFDPTTKKPSKELIKVNLLEGVRTATWKQGQICGFYKRKRGEVLPIIVLYNGKINVVEAVKHDPKTRSGYNLKPRKKGDRQPVVWAFRINDLIDYDPLRRQRTKERHNSDHHLFYFINMLMQTLDENKIGCEFRCHGKYKDPYISLITDAVKINLSEFVVNGNETKKEKENKVKTFGNPKLDSIIEIVKSVSDTFSVMLRKNVEHNTLIIQSKAIKSEVAWFPKEAKPILDALDEVETSLKVPKDILLGRIVIEYYKLIIEPQYSEDTDSVPKMFEACFEEDFGTSALTEKNEE